MDPRFILSLLSVAGGFVVVGGGLYLIAHQKNIASPEGNAIEVEIPLLGRIKTNYPAGLALALGVFLILYPLVTWPKAPEKIPISGKITVKGRPSAEGIMIGIVPGTLGVTNTDGSYTVEVPGGERSYTAVAYYRDDRSRLVQVAGVNVTLGGGSFSTELGSD